MVSIDYSIDLGAFGYGRRGTAILKRADINKDLSQFTLPQEYLHVKWVDNHTVSAKVDIMESIRSGVKAHMPDTTMNGIRVKVSPFDYINSGDTLNIVSQSPSPDGKYVLACYRYNSIHNDGPLHISVIKKNNKIPKYGNFFIGDRSSDYVLKAGWNKASELLFFSNSLVAEMIPYFFVANRFNIKYHIITDDKNFGTKYRLE